MRIALFHNLPSGGARRHTYEQVRELAHRGHELVEFAPSTADLGFCSITPFAQQRVFPSPRARQLRRRIPLLTPYVHAAQGVMMLRNAERLNERIADEIDDGGFDLVLAKDCQHIMNPYVLRYLRTPVVFQAHHGLRHQAEDRPPNRDSDSAAVSFLKGLYYSPAKRIYQYKFARDARRNIRSASLVLTNSEFSKSLLAQHYEVAAHVVYPGIRTDVFAPGPVHKAGYVLCVGALIYSKGYRFLVSALSQIPSDLRPSLFIAANSTDQEEAVVVRAMAARLGVQLHIEEITSDDRLVEVYRRARVFVYAPEQEALGMAPLEAMACGIPVVAVGEGGVRETVMDGETGWLVGRDSSAFAQRLRELLADEKQRSRMGEAGVAYVRSAWSWRRAVDQLEARFGLLPAS